MVWIFAILLFLIFSDDYSVGVRDAIVDTFLNNQNVVVISRYYDTKEWKNLMDFDITLKNDVRMKIEGCKKNKNGEFVYESIEEINDYWLREIFYSADWNMYLNRFGMNSPKGIFGNDSLEYLLDNYQEVYDFCMDAPEFDGSSYYEKKKILDNIPDKFMYNVYNKKTGKLLGVAKLYKTKKAKCRC